MAQKGQNLLHVCRSCRQQLEKFSQRTSTRPFSSTTQRSKTIPSFTPTPSPDLNALLLDFRTRVFTPSALASNHRALIYKKSRHHLLNNEPGVTVTLSNDEEVHLQPADRWDKPNKRKSLIQLVRILGESSASETWQNLPPFLEGLKQASEQLPKGFLERITRKANEQRQTGVMVKCAGMVKSTGARLCDAGFAREIMLGLHSRAVADGFAGEESLKACKQAEHVVLLMEEQEHCGGKLSEGEIDMRKDMTVLAVLLELGAAKASISGNQEEDVRKVEGYAKRVVAAKGNGVIPASASQKSTGPAQAGQRLENLLPLLNGLKLAVKVITDRHLVRDLQARLDQVEIQVKKGVAEVKDAADGKQRRPLFMYEQLQQK